MKKLLVLLALVGVSAFGRDANQMKYVRLLEPTYSTNATVTGSAVDISTYKGNACVVFMSGTASATNQNITFTLQHSTDSGFSSPETVTNINASAGVATVTGGDATTNTIVTSTYSIDTARLHKYLRVVRVQSLANQVAPCSVLFVAPMKAE